MRWVFAAVAAATMAGCGAPQDVDLEVQSYSIGRPVEMCCNGGAFYKDIECPDGDVHRVKVRAPDTETTDLALENWRLVWDDGHRTGASLNSTSEEPHRSFDPVYIVGLGACAPGPGRFIAFVELNDVHGGRAGRAAAPGPS